jgi:Spirocyclase AveC-like
MAVEMDVRPEAGRASSEVRTVVVEERRFRPVMVWGGIGAAWLAFVVYLVVRWVTSSDFNRVHTGPDPVPTSAKVAAITLELALPIIAIYMLWHFVAKPLIRGPKGQRQLSFDGMLAIAWWLMYFPGDAWLNYTQNNFLFNSYAINFGSWYNFVPGWQSPNERYLPEPILIWGFGYLVFFVTFVMITNWVMRKWKARFPRTGFLGLLGVAYVTSVILDWVMETPFLRLHLYAYGGVIKWMTPFAGKQYQFPASEWLLLPLFPMATMAMLRYYHYERGINPLFKGIDRVNIGRKGRQALSLLAVYGFAQMALLAYNVPAQWFATHDDTFPHFPSYLMNRMCGPTSPTKVPCAGKHTPIPRVR